jgi:hypothetical protein
VNCSERSLSGESMLEMERRSRWDVKSDSRYVDEGVSFRARSSANRIICSWVLVSCDVLGGYSRFFRLCTSFCDEGCSSLRRNFWIRYFRSSSEIVHSDTTFPLWTNSGTKSSYFELKSSILRIMGSSNQLNDCSARSFRWKSDRARESADLAKYANEVLVEYNASR